MVTWKLWLAVLLTSCTDSEGIQEYLEKTIGKEPDVTPLCTNKTGNFITLIICKIRTEVNQGEECRLLYRYGQDFVHECDSRFTLVKEKHTMFLHLINLTPKESGNHTCECTYTGGTHTLHLNITVKEDEDEDDEVLATATDIPLSYVYVGVTIFIIVICIILGFVYTKRRHERQTEPITSQPNTILPMEAEAIEPYSVFIQTENGLYTTARIHSLKTRTNNVSNT
ncbi:uncharacterized protein LOC125000569 isoform X2 [Mugil cephalus]|uniref:uncharacterized protein LOC125000569 isoform X2 n=1 Tax=Mugil cephalus TaxID=48193 RepID=UPI001FB80E5F|nr:uncharacterized protein LOC125000569 isoform X2 [Mugil cephalus]